MMAPPKLSSLEKKELDRYTKSLTLKMVQLIIQSRLGEKVCTASNPAPSSTDWFNLSVDDIMEVSAETKRALAGQLPGIGNPICVEMSLKTADGDSLILENWCLGVSELTDASTAPSGSHTIYNCLGMLLKSVIVATRVTPAYRLSRRQGQDSYVMCYKVFMGEPSYSNLGEGFETIRVGQVCIPSGIFHITVLYRTKMTLSPQRMDKMCPILVKSNYFQRDANSPDLRTYNKSESKSEMTYCQEGAEASSDGVSKTDDSKDQETVCSSTEIFARDRKKVGAFADFEDPPYVGLPDDTDIPFSSLIRPNRWDHRESGVPRLHAVCEGSSGDTAGEIEERGPTRQMWPEPITRPNVTTTEDEDFVLVELKTPFAGPDPSNDLGAFYRECQVAPPLQLFTGSGTPTDEMQDITSQLQYFEVNMKEYDSFVQSLCDTDFGVTQEAQ